MKAQGKLNKGVHPSELTGDERAAILAPVDRESFLVEEDRDLARSGEPRGYGLEARTWRDR